MNSIPAIWYCIQNNMMNASVWIGKQISFDQWLISLFKLLKWKIICSREFAIPWKGLKGNMLSSYLFKHLNDNISNKLLHTPFFVWVENVDFLLLIAMQSFHNLNEGESFYRWVILHEKAGSLLLEPKISGWLTARLSHISPHIDQHE